MSLRVDLGGNASGFEQMLNTARTQAKAFSNSVERDVTSSWTGLGKSFAIGIAGLFTAQGVKSTFEWFVNTGKEIKEQAEQVNMSTDAWQKWKDSVDTANVSTGVFMRTIQTLQEKFTSALTDPKARGELSRLGFSDKDVTEGFDDSKLKRALENSKGSDLQRSYLKDVIGTRGLMTAPAILGKLPDAKSLFSKDDLKEAEDAAKKIRELGRLGDELKIKAVEIATSDSPSASYTARLFEFVMGKLGIRPNKKKGAVLKAAPSETADETANGEPAHESPAIPQVDPMDAKLAQQKEELALHEQERQQKLLDSQRSLMTIGDRRASIMGEMPKLQKQVAERNAKMKGEDFLTEAQKNELAGITGKARDYSVNALRVKYQDETDTMQLRYNRDKGDLKEKSLAFGADSMSKVGLYSASAVAFNPVLGVAQKQLSVQEKILARLSPHNADNTTDPFAP
jgi:hypothetical protein